MQDHEDDIDSLSLIPGSGGAFEVEIDGKLVFSKHKSGRFPEYDEVAKSLG